MTPRSGKLRLLSAAAVSTGLALSVGLPAASAAGQSPAKNLPTILRQSPLAAKALPSHAFGLGAQVHRSTVPAPQYNLYGSPATFTISGQKIMLLVDASKDSSTTPAAADVYLSKNLTETNTNFSGEEHTFNFQNLKTADLAITGSGGTASKAELTLGSTQIGPFGSLSLTFTPSGGYKSGKCTNSAQGYYDRYYTGTLSGSVDFKTANSKESSSFGELKGSVSLKNSELDLDNGCEPPIPTGGKTICSKGFLWSSPATATKSGGYSGTEEALGEQFSSGGTTFKLADIERSVGLTGLGTGVSGTRSDLLLSSTVTQSLSTASAAPHKLTAKVSASSSDKYLKGSATETAASSKKTAGYKCYVSSSSTSQKTQYYTSGSAPFVYTPGSTKFAGKSGIGGAVTPSAVTDKDGSNGGYVSGDSYS